jgi:integrase
MPTVNFYLKKAEKTSKKSLIYLQFKYNGRKLVYSFGQTIDPGSWSSAKQRVKSNSITTSDGQYSLNDLLTNLNTVCLKAYNSELLNGIPTPITLKGYLEQFINKNRQPTSEGPSLLKLIDRFIAGEIKNKGREKALNTIKKYVTTKNHLLSFQKDEKYKVDFDSITLDFSYKFSTYLRNSLNLQQNTIAKDFSLIKLFMGEAVDLGYTSNMQFKHRKFSVSEVETDAVFLSESEIMSLYKQDFSGNRKLEQVRDLFVFGCYIGLRFSDYSNIKSENIVKINGDYFIKLMTKKTGDLVIIPCNPIVLEIFSKYNHNENKLPRSISNQKFNHYIKEAVRITGFTEKGRLATHPEKELHECISSHTARRLEAPIKLTISGRGKLTTCFAGEDLCVHVC